MQLEQFGQFPFLDPRLIEGLLVAPPRRLPPDRRHTPPQIQRRSLPDHPQRNPPILLIDPGLLPQPPLVHSHNIPPPGRLPPPLRPDYLPQQNAVLAGQLREVLLGVVRAGELLALGEEVGVVGVGAVGGGFAGEDVVDAREVAGVEGLLVEEGGEAGAGGAVVVEGFAHSKNYKGME